MSIGDDSIEGLLKNLKQTLDVDSKEKSSSNKRESNGCNNNWKNDGKSEFNENFTSVKNESINNDLVFVLRKKGEKLKEKDKDLLKENVISQLESEVTRFVVSFCSSDDGVKFIKSLIALSLESKDDFIKSTIKDEISKKIQEVLASR